MTQMSKSFVARIVFGAVALAGVAAAVPASAHPYDGRDWHNDRGWAERGFFDGDRHDWRPAPVRIELDGAGYYEGYRHDWRPMRYHDGDYGQVVYAHGYDRRW